MGVDQTNVLSAAEGTPLTIHEADFTVGPKCDDVNAGGSWRCITHGEGFGNNLQMWSHTGDNREHVVAWVCDVHGPEVP